MICNTSIPCGIQVDNYFVVFYGRRGTTATPRPSSGRRTSHHDSHSRRALRYSTVRPSTLRAFHSRVAPRGPSGGRQAHGGTSHAPLDERPRDETSGLWTTRSPGPTPAPGLAACPRSPIIATWRPRTRYTPLTAHTAAWGARLSTQAPALNACLCRLSARPALYRRCIGRKRSDRPAVRGRNVYGLRPRERSVPHGSPPDASGSAFDGVRGRAHRRLPLTATLK